MCHSSVVCSCIPLHSFFPPPPPPPPRLVMPPVRRVHMCVSRLFTEKLGSPNAHSGTASGKGGRAEKNNMGVRAKHARHPGVWAAQVLSAAFFTLHRQRIAPDRQANGCQNQLAKTCPGVYPPALVPLCAQQPPPSACPPIHPVPSPATRQHSPVHCAHILLGLLAEAAPRVLHDLNLLLHHLQRALMVWRQPIEWGG